MHKIDMQLSGIFFYILNFCVLYMVLVYLVLSEFEPRSDTTLCDQVRQ
jgi:hypothetical protein